MWCVCEQQTGLNEWVVFEGVGLLVYYSNGMVAFGRYKILNTENFLWFSFCTRLCVCVCTYIKVWQRGGRLVSRPHISIYL